MKLSPELVQGLAAGENAAWAAFFKDFDPLIRSVTTWSKWRFAPDVQEDIAQQVRTELMKSGAGLAEKKDLDSFIKKICVRRCIDEVRRQVRQRNRFVSLTPVRTGDGDLLEYPIKAGEEWDPVRTILLTERARALDGLLRQLDATCVTAIRHFYLEGLAYKAIAERLKIAVNTVGSRLAKCLDKLKGLAAKDSALGEDLAVPVD